MKITKEYCDKIIENCDAFKRKDEKINNYKVCQYSYLLSSFEDFKNPVKNNKNYNAYELRGITFIENKKFLMLSKFYCLNQTIGYMYEDVKDKKIISVQDKADGSMIRFVRFPDGKVLAKTKFSFFSEQAKMAQEIYNSDEILREFINKTIDKNLAAIFELQSPNNRIVLYYPKTKLVLLQIREEDTGKYLDIYSSFDTRIERVKKEENLTLDEYIKLSETLTNKEGWVITFEDGQIIKLKTKWYFNLHHLVTSATGQPHYILRLVVDDLIDDAIASIPLDFKNLRKYIEFLEKSMNDWIRKSLIEVKDLMKELKLVDRKTFALKYKKHPLFSIIMRTIGFEKIHDEDIINLIKKFVHKKISKLTHCLVFMKKELKIDIENSGGLL